MGYGEGQGGQVRVRKPRRMPRLMGSIGFPASSSLGVSRSIGRERKRVVSTRMPSVPSVYSELLMVVGGSGVTLSAVKFGSGGRSLIEGIAVPFIGRDTDGEFFTKDSNLGLDFVSEPVLLYHHGLDPSLGTAVIGRVKSRVITAKKTEVPVEYRLHRLGDRWAAYDVLIDNVSLVSTYRSQFDRIIQSGGFSDLLKRMRDKEREGSTADAVIR